MLPLKAAHILNLRHEQSTQGGNSHYTWSSPRSIPAARKPGGRSSPAEFHRFGKVVDLLSGALLEVVAGLVAPLAIVSRKDSLAVFLYEVGVPEDVSKVHPLLGSVLANPAVKAFADARRGLLQQCDQVVGGCCFLFDGLMDQAVEDFYVITNPAHRKIIPQIRLVVKGISSNFRGACFVRFGKVKGVATTFFDEQRIDGADKEPGHMQHISYCFIVPSGVFHDHSDFPFNRFQLLY